MYETRSHTTNRCGVSLFNLFIAIVVMSDFKWRESILLVFSKGDIIQFLQCIWCNLIPVVMPADRIRKYISQCQSCFVFTQTKWVSALNDGGSMWINQNCCARRAAVTLEMRRGRVCAPSAGERSTRKLGRGRSRRTGPWLKSESGGFVERL